MAKVELKKVRKVFPGDIEAVKGADLTVEDGEFLVLVGPSGCGKSTLLRLIAGLEELTDGEVLIDDNVVNRVPPKDRDIAMVFQNYALYPHMTVYKNMAFGLKLRKFPKAEIDSRVREAAAMLGIEDLLDRRPKGLSGGQRQRVAVGRAIVRHPKVFLFDEPLSNLDAKLRIQMRAELSRLHSSLKTTMIYVTHDQIEAMTMGDRIVVLLDGAIQQVAKPMELYAEPANMFVAGFIGSPPMNLFKGKLRSEGGTLEFQEETGAFSLALANGQDEALRRYEGKDVHFGLRPHDVKPVTGESSGVISARVDVIEPMGSEIYLHLDANGTSLTARVGPEVKVGIGEKVAFRADMGKAHFFDSDTHAAIR